MASKSTKEMLERIMAQAKSGRANPKEDYRERALKLFPWVCGRCGREFEGQNLKDLTVHHKDHNHDHNPPDGSNWELLCVYCHDNEHSRQEVADSYSGPETDQGSETFSTHSPFAGLADLLKDKDK